MSEALELSERKALGAFYTPDDAAHYMATWAIRGETETVLEPSVGDGTFITACTHVAESMHWTRPNYITFEIDSKAARNVVERGVLSPHEISVGDFLEGTIQPATVVIGNPPYVRIRSLPQNQAASALRASADDMGERMQSSGSTWMPFVLRAARFLRPAGRLALVLPWDSTYVRYARPLWQHLGETFGDLRVVRVRDRVFPDISQDVILLFADRKGRSTRSITFETYNSITDLRSGHIESVATVSIERIMRGDRVFQEALLPAGTTDVITATHRLTIPTRQLVNFNIGYVSGHKKFFHPGRESGLPESSLVPAVSDARALRGAGLKTSGIRDDAVTRLWLPRAPLSAEEQQYVRLGETRGVHQRYKARTRSPWYVVPYVKTPDILLSVFATRPLLMVNDAELVASNSLLCGYLRAGTAESFAASWYSSLTLLNAELEVHSLGGGVLVLVPNEAGNVRVLRPELASKDRLDRVHACLLEGNPAGAYATGDDAIERELGSDAVRVLRDGVAQLESWRVR